MLGNNKAFNRESSSPGSMGSASNQLTLIAGETLGYPRAVMLDVFNNVVLFNPTSAVAGSLIGVTMHSAALGTTVDIITQGKLTYTGWGLVSGAVQYAGALGIISNNPVTSGNQQALGLALTTDSILIKDLQSVDLI